jgi:exonuclease VII large subunit
MRVLPGLLLAAALFSLSPALVAPAPAAAQAAAIPKQAVASPEVQKEFAGFIASFRAALKANDAKAVASLTKMPFLSHTEMYDAAAFQNKVYKKEFTAKTRACIERSKPLYDRAPDKTESYSIFCGEEIFTFTRTPEGVLFTEIGVND